MQSDAEFTSTFIAECAARGETAIAAAKKEIQDIDSKLSEAERLKIRRMKLLAVLEFFGDDTYRRRRASATPSSDDIDVSENRELLIKIHEIIKESNPILVRDLIIGVGGYEQDALVMRLVKWLGDQEIVSRDSEGRVKPGKNWTKEI